MSQELAHKILYSIRKRNNDKLALNEELSSYTFPMINVSMITHFSILAC
jgi:hypothetical protein